MENEIFLKELGKKIRTLRKSKRITIRQMAEITQIDRVNLSRIEIRGKNAHILTVKAIADCLGVEMTELLNLQHGKERKER